MLNKPSTRSPEQRYQEALVRIVEHLQAQDYETHRCWFALAIAQEALGSTGDPTK